MTGLRRTPSFVLATLLACGSTPEISPVDASMETGVAEGGVDGAAVSESSTRLDSGPVSDGAETESASAPIVALASTITDIGAAWTTVVADGAWRSLYTSTVDASAGDVLRLHAQAELTNDNVGAGIDIELRLLAGGVPVGNATMQTALEEWGHHTPLWADAILPVSGAGTVVVEAQTSATYAAGPTLSMKVESYGHLVIEDYASFASIEAARARGAWLLGEARVAGTVDANFYGRTGFDETDAYSIPLTSAAGDKLRLLGMATTTGELCSNLTGPGQVQGELQGQELARDGTIGLDRVVSGFTPVSPAASQNSSPGYGSLALFSDGVDAPSPGLHTYMMLLNGTDGCEVPIVAAGGQLAALRFTSPAPGGLAYAGGASTTVADQMITADGQDRVVASQTITGDANDVLRAVGQVQLGFPSGAASAFDVVMYLRLAGPATDFRSPPMVETLSSLLAELPLRSELVTALPAAGSYTLAVYVGANQSGNGQLPLTGAMSGLYVDTYRVVH